jgi:hypothetical protein
MKKERPAWWGGPLDAGGSDGLIGRGRTFNVLG